MCVIILGEKKHIPLDILKKAENSNPHGAGLAWINDKKEVEYIKSEKLTAQNIFDFIKTEKIKLPYVVHFRITSVGDTCDQLCHPFKLSSLNNTLKGTDKAGVLFHNGTYKGYEMDLNLWKIHKNTPENDKEFKGKMSDSRGMAILANKKRFGLGYLKLIPNGNKLVVLTPKGIRKFGKGWSKVEDLQCSNNYFNFTSDYSWESCEGSWYQSYGKKTETTTKQTCLPVKTDQVKKLTEDQKMKISLKSKVEETKTPIDTMLYDLRTSIEEVKDEQILNESELANAEEYIMDFNEQDYCKMKRVDLDIKLQQLEEEYIVIYESELKKQKGYLYNSKGINDFKTKHESIYYRIKQDQTIVLQ